MFFRQCTQPSNAGEEKKKPDLQFIFVPKQGAWRDLAELLCILMKLWFLCKTESNKNDLIWSNRGQDIPKFTP